ncbi:hypothetical protein NDU88_002740 [Pleurodeles waltl]|uniref:Uncharacterized protein n=1 Tax=Pleurodeles waltl TaxID=8319 RepID=A0AAV7VFF8_PLEWA|nr:hypothetical protein NDU88_002740 [Pleurodeles waltl]
MQTRRHSADRTLHYQQNTVRATPLSPSGSARQLQLPKQPHRHSTLGNRRLRFPASVRCGETRCVIHRTALASARPHPEPRCSAAAVNEQLQLHLIKELTMCQLAPALPLKPQHSLIAPLELLGDGP